MEVDNPFELVLDRLREKGWMQGGYGYNKGPNCIIGGIKAVKGLDTQSWMSHSSEVDFLTPIVVDQYPDRAEGHLGEVPNFNDHPDTTFADVERVLEKAAVKWEEERVMRNE